MKKRILSILLALCMLFCLVPTTAFAADCAEDLVDPVIWIHLSSDGGGYYDVLNGTWTAADFFQPGKAPKGAKITAVTPPTSPSIPVSVNVNSDGTLNCTKTENTTEPVPKSETYTVTITSDDYAPISAPLTVRQYLNAGFRGPVYFDDELLYGDTYTYTCRVNNPGENGVWSALIQDPQMFEIYKETTDTTSEPGKSIYTVHIRAIKAGARVTCIDFLYVSDTTMASSKVSRGAVTGGAVRTRPLTVTAGSATITEGNALPTDLVTCTGLLNSEGRKDDRDTVLDNALGYQLLDANNEEVTADTARNTPGTYTVVPAATLKSGWGERYSLNKVNGTLTVENQPDEQFTLAPGGRYYFDLSAMNIPGTVNSNLPDSTLHYVPFTYVGTVNAYKLTSAMATTEEYAQQNKYAHSLFVADYAVTLKVNWNNLDTASLIFGKNYASGGVDYTLRAPSVGSGFTGSDDSERGTPQSNEWDAVLDKNSGYVKNWNDIYSWGQDTSSYESWYRAVRGSNSARYWSNGYASTSHPLVGFRPVLEVLNPGTLGADGLKAVTLDLGGGKLGNSSEDIQIIVKTGSDFTAPASDDLTRPDGDTGNFFMWRGSNGKFYVPGDSVPADVTALTVQWTVPTYAVTLHPNGGTINSGNVTGYTYGVGVTLPTADDMTNTGHTFKGWYDNENLTGSPVTAIGGTGTGNKEYWAKWEINQYTITFDTNGGSEIAPITQDYGTAITAPADPTREGYTFIGWDREIPKTMPAENITLKARWKDIEKPTGEIVIGANKWQKFLNKLTFGLFFKDTQEVTINAADNSGTVFISYLVTDRDLSEAELQSLVFSGYEEPFRINPNGEYIVYAMLVDANLNITYLRSDRITLDNVQPVITGIENGKTYCEAQTVTVDEKYVDTVTVNGTKVTLDKNNSFTLSPADGEQKIVATDKAGNTAEMTVTVNDGHTGGTATCTERAVCEVCGKAYGEPDPKNHTDLQHIPAKAATKTTTGNIEHWYCEDCGKYFADAAATKEIKQADTVTAKLSGAAKSPQTGDNSGVVTVLLLSGGAFICLVSRRKKRTHTV
ncbi:MAG: InlB B-repeat-containing protein [Acutalibacteraceae bacterium]|nr:InlB B-repeat-containing protein [Acutalibacteraceae bacterium]